MSVRRVHGGRVENYLTIICAGFVCLSRLIFNSALWRVTSCCVSIGTLGTFLGYTWGLFSVIALASCSHGIIFVDKHNICLQHKSVRAQCCFSTCATRSMCISNIASIWLYFPSSRWLHAATAWYLGINTTYVCNTSQFQLNAILVLVLRAVCVFQISKVYAFS